MNHSSKSAKDFLEATMGDFDLGSELMRTLLDGYETYDDYVKYGNAITPVARRSSGSSRALARRRPA